MGPIHEEDVPRSRSREPEGRGGVRSWSARGQAAASKPRTFDISSHNSGGDSALPAIVQAMRKQREQDAEERAEQLQSLN